jgi:hypothetical protein
MVRQRNALWTDEENERLTVARGLSVAWAAVAFKPSITPVRKQARKLGTSFPPARIVRQTLADARSSGPR